MFIWRYGVVSDKCDLTDLDQWISPRMLKEDAPKAPAALREALEKFVASSKF
jgi:hypothetical protein